MKKYLIILFLFLSSVAFSTTYYVSTSGSNGNTGLDTTHAWLTLDYAELHATTAGSIIALRGGDTWSLATALRITHSGTAGNFITWDGHLWGTGALAKIEASGNRASPNLSIVNLTNCSYVTFQYIKIDGNNHDNCFGIAVGGVGDYYSAGTHTVGESYINIQHNTVKRCGGTGTYACGIVVMAGDYDITNVRVLYNTVDSTGAHNITFYPVSYAYAAYPIAGHSISNSYIGHNALSNYRLYSGNTGYGIHINHKCINDTVEYNTVTDPVGRNHMIAVDGFAVDVSHGCYSTGTVIRYNNLNAKSSITNAGAVIYITIGSPKTAVIYGNLIKNTANDEGQFGIYILQGVDWTGASFNIYNNTIYLDKGRGVYDGTNIAGVTTFKNNIVYCGGTSVCLFASGASTLTHNNNLYYHPGGTTYTQTASTARTAAQTLAWETGSVVTDPKFTTNFTDLTLQVTSPAIGVGVAVTGYVVDYAGNAVPNPPSIGAYEYGTSPSPPNFAIVTTTAPSNVWTRGVIIVGVVTSDGGGTVSARGVCYGTSAHPTIAGSHTSNGTGVGSFNAEITGLSANTIYYTRGYATNEAGTSYTDDVPIKTPLWSPDRWQGKTGKWNGKNAIFK